MYRRSRIAQPQASLKTTNLLLFGPIGKNGCGQNDWVGLDPNATAPGEMPGSHVAFAEAFGRAGAGTASCRCDGGGVYHPEKYSVSW